MFGTQSQLEKELEKERLQEEAKYDMMIKELKEIGVKMNPDMEVFYSKTPNDKKVAKMLRAYFRSLGYKCYLGNMWFCGFSLIKYGLLIRW